MVLCETNMGGPVVTELQTRLKDGGYYNGPIDGIVGSATLSGVSAYQQAKGLPRGGLTIETLTQLGVRVN